MAVAVMGIVRVRARAHVGIGLGMIRQGGRLGSRTRRVVVVVVEVAFGVWTRRRI